VILFRSSCFPALCSAGEPIASVGLLLVSKERPEMPKIYHSGVRAAVHEAMERLYAVGLIDQDEMRVFDDLCLTAVADKEQGAVASEAPRIASELPDGPAVRVRTIQF
jgi:hypothetical protein